MIRVSTLAGDPEAEARLAAAVSSHPELELTLRCVDRVEALAVVTARDADVLLCAGLPVWLDAELCDRARAAGMRVVGLASGPRERGRFEELGATVLPVGASPEFVAALCRTATERSPHPGPQGTGGRGRLVAVWGPKGAPGRTRVCVELALHASAGGVRTLLVDGDPYGGDVVQMLGIEDEVPSVVWASAVASDGRFEELSAGLRTVRGAAVLGGLGRAALWADVGAYGWQRLLDWARREFDLVACDCGFCLEDDPDGRNAMARSAVGAADAVVAVGRADPVGLRHLVWGLQELGGLVDAGRLIVVLNRAGRTRREAAELLAEHAGVVPTALLPEAPEAERALAEGRAFLEIRPAGAFSAQMRELAARLGVPVRARGLLTRLSGRAS